MKAAAAAIPAIVPQAFFRIFFIETELCGYAASSSEIVHGFDVMPAATAGVVFKVECTRTKLYPAKYNATACFRFSNFFENPRHSRVSLRMKVRIDKLLRSTSEVQIPSSFGSPEIAVLIAAATMHHHNFITADDRVP